MSILDLQMTFLRYARLEAEILPPKNVFGTEGLYVDFAQRSETTTKAFWQERWFLYVVVAVVIIIIFVALAIFLLRRSKKKAQVT